MGYFADQEIEQLSAELEAERALNKIASGQIAGLQQTVEDQARRLREWEQMWEAIRRLFGSPTREHADTP